MESPDTVEHYTAKLDTPIYRLFLTPKMHQNDVIPRPNVDNSVKVTSDKFRHKNLLSRTDFLYTFKH